MGGRGEVGRKRERERILHLSPMLEATYYLVGHVSFNLAFTVYYAVD